jgi:YebC/PmpR family DNA-binding regulatory protein
MGKQWKAKWQAAGANARGRMFGKMSKEIMIAARGGADPSMNAALRMALENARKNSMPKDTVERAVKKGAGLLDEPVDFSTVTYEGYAPHNVPVIVECLTDNQRRTAPNMRVLFRTGSLGGAGSVSWDFDRCGAIEALPPAGGEDPEEAAIEAGAQDVEPDDNDGARFITAPTEVNMVGMALTERGWTVSSQKLVWIPKNPMTLDEDALAEVEAFLAALDEDDDVHEIYAGLA